VKISELKIDDDYKSCLPELSVDEYTNLEKSIVKSGVHSPIIIWDKTVIDGHNRLIICKAHGIEEVPVKELSFDSKEDALAWILSNQLSRRNLTDFQRNVIALKYKDVIAAKAEERKRAGQILGGKARHDSALRSNGHRAETTRTEVARIAGTSEGSIQRTEFILKNGTEEQKERAMRGGQGNSISTIAKEIKREIEPQKICYRCGKAFPVSKMTRINVQRDLYACKECERERREKGKKDAVSDSISQTVERIKSGESTSYTRDNVFEELKYAADGLVASWRSIILEHKDLITQDETIVEDAIVYLEEQFRGEDINVQFKQA